MKKHLPIIFILILAAVLRFWNYNQLCFSYDELNAMGRTLFLNFSDLWNFGIKVDAHPPLVQLWLYYYQKIFGDAEPLIKLPFILAGLAAIYYSYRIAKKWFNETTALLTATLLACIQFTIMYTQIARPYASGLFFCVMSTWHWWNWIESGKKWNYAWFIVFSALCAWNHYFSFLFAVMLGLSGFIFIKRKNIKYYLLSGLIILLLILPASSVYLFQLKNGSIGGWLSEPSADFYLKFLQYVFHFSIPFYIVTGSIILFGLFTPDHAAVVRSNKFRLLCFAWSAVPFLIAYLYSITKSPILQYSTLFFSFPFTVMLIFSLISEKKYILNIALVSVMAGTAIFTLVKDRQHYSYFYRQPFDAMVKNTIHLQDSLGAENISVYLNAETYFKYYYEKKYGRVIKTLPRKENMDVPFFKRILDSVKTDYFIIANPYHQYKGLIRDRYPRIMFREFGNAFNYFCFSKKGNDNYNEYDGFSTVTYCDTVSSEPGWHYSVANVFSDSVNNKGKNVFAFSKGQEYEFLWHGKVREFIKDKSDWIYANVDFLYPRSIKKALLVMEVSEAGKVLLWKAQDIQEFAEKKKKWYRAHYAVEMTDVTEKFFDPEVKVFIWNIGKDSLLIRRMEIYTEPGNKNVFNLLEKMN